MKRMLTAILMSVLLFPINVSAEQLVFSVLEDFAPYQYMENEKSVGCDVDIMNEVCKRLNIELKVKPLPWKRALKTAENGDSSGLLTVLHTAERENFLYFTSEPVHIQKNVIIARKGSGITIKGFDDLKGKEVGVVANFSYGPEFDKYEGLKKTVCYGQEELVRIVDKERIDLAMGAEDPFRFIWKKLNLKERFEVVYVIAEIQAYTGFSKKGCGEKGKVMADKFSEVMRQMKAEGVTQQIMDKYR
ncbi:MAG: hypothetical protein BWK80_05120 [Desulfobacteraceae bacterium IS3]|nr:MAG: hypothetical protein BWK80_05120 [Desulfobacteraceae bacterium IS3]